MVIESVAFVKPSGEPLPRLGWADLGRTVWSPPYRRAVAWAVPMLLLAYGFAMANFTLAGDDWFAVFPEATLDTHFALVAGRWVMPLVWAVTGNGAFVPFFSFAIALGLLAVAGLVAAATWGWARPWGIFAVVTLFVVNPLFADSLSTKPGHVSLPLAMICAALAGWVLLRWRGARLWRAAISVLLLVLSLASYQPTALAFVVVVIGCEVIRVGWGDGSYWGRAWRRWLEILLVVLAAVALYVVSVWVAWWVTATDPRATQSMYSLTGGYPLTPGELVRSLGYGLRMTGRFWLGSTPLYPLALKVVSLALIAAGAATALAAARRPVRVSRLGARAWLVALATASGVVPFAVLFLRDRPTLRASVFTTVGLVVGFWAGLLLERAAGGPGSGRRRWVIVAGVALVLVAALGSAHQINKGYFGLHLNNQRDLANANRMLSVMEEMPEFRRGEQVRVQLVGLVRYSVRAEPFSSPVPGVPGQTIVNCSGLACQNRLVNMLNLLGGGSRSFVTGSVARDPEVRAGIEAMPVWPKPGSIQYLAGTFVIKGS